MSEQSAEQEPEGDIAELCDAVNDAAGKTGVIWTTFVTLEVYLAIAFASVKQRDLLLGTPVDLPLFGVKLPLAGFFLVAPLILIIFHFYVFLYFSLLSSDISVLNSSLLEKGTGGELYRRRLDKFYFVQFLAGAKDVRNGFIGFALRAIGWITMVATPAILLLQCQARFLPFHDEAITWSHRVFIGLDLIVINYFWWRTRKEDHAILTTTWTHVFFVAGGFSTILVLAISLIAFSFPGELNPLAIDTYEAFGGENGWLPNRIIISDETIVDPEKLEKSQVSRSLIKRDLRFAIIRHSDLRKVNFSGAILDKAILVDDDLRGALFGCPIRQRDVDLKGMSLNDRCAAWDSTPCASLLEVSLASSRLSGAILNGARLSASKLDGTNLDGAELAGAHLEGATLRDARLHGANLDYAQLSGADLTMAKLTGASLNGAILWGDELRQADLSGVSAVHASFDGVLLSHTDFTAATLAGSSAFKAAAYEHATLDRRRIWFGAKDGTADLTNIDTQQDPGIAAQKINRLMQLKDTSDGCSTLARGNAHAWIEKLNAASPAPEEFALARMKLGALFSGKNGSPFPADKTLVTQPWPTIPTAAEATIAAKKAESEIATLACRGTNAPYVAHGLIANGRLAALSALSKAALISRLQIGSHPKPDTQNDCEGAVGLDATDAVILEALRDAGKSE